jgi:ferredoxin
MVINATISVISLRSVLLVEKTRVPGKKRPTCRKSPTNLMAYWCIEYTSTIAEFDLTTLVVICTGCIGSCYSNYRTTTTAPSKDGIWLPQEEFEDTKGVIRIRKSKIMWCTLMKHCILQQTTNNCPLG